MPTPVPAGWRLVRQYEAGKINVAMYQRESDQLNVSMSWEADNTPPYLHMAFSKLRAKPTEEEAQRAAAELLPGRRVSAFRTFEQMSNLHRATTHAKVYFHEGEAS